MTLDQFDQLRRWHAGHADHPVEARLWSAVLTLWLAACVGAPVAWLLRQDGLALAALPLLFAPGAYVALRRWLHRRQRLRCDWIVALG